MTQVFRKRFAELEQQLAQVEATKRAQYSDYSGHYEAVDDELLLNWCVKARNLLSSSCGKESEHFLSFVEAEKPQAYLHNDYTVKRVKAVFLAAKEDFEGGYLASVRQLVQAELFDSELEQAKELQSSGFHVAAAVIAGVVLETTLRDLCAQSGLLTGKMDKMNADLAKAGKYNLLIQKRITALAGIRNSAAHGNASEFTKEDVSSMIGEVERFVADILS
ncbi:DUF4145 domain-containing protein [Azospira sp. I09]|uniref:DUF4145 domain-containing protein n=1 Tax=Azospira sp. I09 TaxID=1765049 RepID=UPI0012610A66|nr:DUF4145 domain-containing protein [Azospira sp. I09]BBN90329.1 hypothetical protein AZSP09_33520 [Azospira sp. I09]